ncbi:MAG: 3-hydroxyacyl-CoA dehydrogenase NAD-binding domain-containing protein [Actinobacteria bacterium]|nr:3-hydroxyacyl-CoA dehydrogenase NAD-binding domain-containing protein [Actinomycetota bacterium]
MKRVEDVKKIAIIGGGMMGHGTAQVFAVAGYDVALMSRKEATLAKAMESIRHDLGFLAERGIGRIEDIEPAIARISTTQSYEEATIGADFVLECAVEDMGLKQELFAMLDKMADPDTVLATNTSVMSITEIASKSQGKYRILGTHWWNPPYLIPLIEVVRTVDVEDWVVDFTMGLMKAAGKHPIECKKDVPGFVANRLQHALWREAISIVEHGVADPATVDESLKFGPGLRLPILAPLENSDMVGADLTLAIHNYVLKYLEDSHEPSPLLREMVAKNELGFKTQKGFYEWTPETMKATRDRLLDYLARVAVQAK